MITHEEGPDGRTGKTLEHDYKSLLGPGNTFASHRDAAINNKKVLLRGQERASGAGSCNQIAYILHPLYSFN